MLLFLVKIWAGSAKCFMSFSWSFHCFQRGYFTLRLLPLLLLATKLCMKFPQLPLMCQRALQLLRLRDSYTKQGSLLFRRMASTGCNANTASPSVLAETKPLVGVCQMTSTVDKEANFAVCLSLIAKAKLRGVQVIYCICSVIYRIWIVMLINIIKSSLLLLFLHCCCCFLEHNTNDVYIAIFLWVLLILVVNRNTSRM